jgi:hypothetical protein
MRAIAVLSIGNVPVYGGVTLDGCGYPCLPFFFVRVKPTSVSGVPGGVRVRKVREKG